jgi:hypothetical protein
MVFEHECIPFVSFRFFHRQKLLLPFRWASRSALGAMAAAALSVFVLFVLFVGNLFCFQLNIRNA